MRFSKFITLISALVITAITQIPSAFAEDEAEAGGITFIPSIGYQQKHLKFEQKLRYTVGLNQYGTDADFEVDLPTINLSLTSSFRKMFVTLKYEKSLVDGIATGDEKLKPVEETYYFTAPGGSSKVNREDINLTIGYNLFRNLNVFMGYMMGETVFEPESTCRWHVTDIAQTCDTTFNPNGIVNMAWVHKVYGVPGGGAYEVTYAEKGPYAGLSYAFQIAEAGTLSFSAAYAKMEGTYEDNLDVFFAPNTDFRYTGDSTGTSYGMTWTAPLGESSNYFIDLRQQTYKMESKDDNGNYPGATADTTETMQGVTAGVQLYF